MNNKQKTRPQRRNSSGLVIRMSLQLMIILYVPSHICNREKKLVVFFCFFLAYYDLTATKNVVLFDVHWVEFRKSEAL